jgi:UDP-glucose-4-epimerase GalE
MADPEKYFRCNVAGTLNLLAAMRGAGVRRIVFSSTCSTYGNPVRLPIDETHPQEPVNPYGLSKLVAERMMREYARQYDFGVVALRYFNAAGCHRSGELGERHDPETHLIPLVLREVLRVASGGSPNDTRLSVFGDDFDTPDGTCIRDYVHVDDLCSAHDLAMQRLLAADSGLWAAFNLGTGSGHSVKEVIDACRRVTATDIRHRVAPRRPGDPALLVATAERARAELGWAPAIPDLDEIVATAWRWFSRAGP